MDIDTVICLHGFWSHGAGMFLIKRRLEKEYGLRALLFSYPSVRGTLDENAAALTGFIQKEGITRTHIVGHSLGGVVALRMYANEANAPPGRLVCLGSPLVDSSAARNLSRRSWGRAIVGRTLREAVLENPLRSCVPNHEVGMIGGTVGLGLGLMTGRLEEPHDGAVTETETRLAGLTDCLALPVNHIGLILSRKVAVQTADFLRKGRFESN